MHSDHHILPEAAVIGVSNIGRAPLVALLSVFLYSGEVHFHL